MEPDAPSDPTQRPTDDTPWRRLPEADPIRIRDPLAELLGMVDAGDPLTVTFAEVAKAAGHACPAVAGAYRGTQLALSALYPEGVPVRGDVAVVVGGDRSDPGLGPMAAVVEHVTGAAGERGFTGFGGYGGRKDLLSFGDLAGPGRRFEFARTDTDRTVEVGFDPAAADVSPPGEGAGPEALLPRLVQGEASPAERERFYEQWHGRVQRILAASSGPPGPFTLDAE